MDTHYLATHNTEPVDSALSLLAYRLNLVKNSLLVIAVCTIS